MDKDNLTDEDEQVPSRPVLLESLRVQIAKKSVVGVRRLISKYGAPMKAIIEEDIGGWIGIFQRFYPKKCLQHWP